MLIIGLTGSIGMGKSMVAAQLARLGAKVCNADDIVHKLLAKDGRAVKLVEKAFKNVVVGGAVNRKALGDIVFKDKAQLKVLEKIMHPLVVGAENEFVRRQQLLGADLVVMDIPLLFETGAEERCDVTLVVTAPHVIQRQRVMRRANMTPEKFHEILKAQMPDSEKRARADFIIETGLGKATSFMACKTLVMTLFS